MALVTPFNKEKQVDYSALQQLIEYNLTNGIDYLVVLGTTGESATLSSEERDAVFAFVAATVSNRVPLVAGVGGNNTQEVVKAMSSFSHTGYSAFLSVGPYYNKPSQSGLLQHYRVIAEASQFPIIIYNVPSRTAMNISAQTTLELAHSSGKFIGIKEASGDFSQIMRILRDKPAGFEVISGDDAITLPMMSLGATGVISVVAQAFPNIFSSMVRCMLDGDLVKARSHHFQLLEGMELFFAEGNPAGIKAALHSIGLCENELRLPLTGVSSSLYNSINTFTKKTLR